ncbi:MAG: hypothetical protein ACLSGI_08255 [Butyricicoccaceae bacterium]
MPVLKGINLSIKRRVRRGARSQQLGQEYAAAANAIVCRPAACYVDMMDTRDENNTYEVRKTVSMVFQNPDNQLSLPLLKKMSHSR